MNEGRSRDFIESALPIIVLSGLLILGFITLQPFLPALLWGLFLSVSLRPLHDRMSRAFGGRMGLATLATVVLMVLLLVLPMVGLARALLAFIPEAIQWLNTNASPALSPDDFANAVGRTAMTEGEDVWMALLADLNHWRIQFGDSVRPVAGWVVGEGRIIGAFVMEIALGVLIAGILLHRAGPLASAFTELSRRVGGSLGTEMLDRSVVTIRSTVFGLLGSAAAQTAVASVAYVIVGAPHWPVLAFLTFLLGLLQIGPVLIWAPLAVWLWSTGEVGLAIFLVAWGALAVGLTDNAVKAAVMSRGADLPAILAFLGAIGGLVTWGIVGVFLGPVIVAVCYQLILRWIGDDTSETLA
jgi:predicted PurR-regulated permease PerM